MFTLPNGNAIDVGMLEVAIEDTDAGNTYFLNRETGEVLLWSDYALTTEEGEELDAEIREGDYVAVDPVPTHEAYQWMVDFVREIVEPADADGAEKLWIALDGKGAFHRFRTTLSRSGDRWMQAWYQWKHEHLNAAVEAWLQDVLA